LAITCFWSWLDAISSNATGLRLHVIGPSGRNIEP
jgi:hypothetical protein